RRRGRAPAGAERATGHRAARHAHAEALGSGGAAGAPRRRGDPWPAGAHPLELVARAGHRRGKPPRGVRLLREVQPVAAGAGRSCWTGARRPKRLTRPRRPRTTKLKTTQAAQNGPARGGARRRQRSRWAVFSSLLDATAGLDGLTAGAAERALF